MPKWCRLSSFAAPVDSGFRLWPRHRAARANGFACLLAHLLKQRFSRLFLLVFCLWQILPGLGQVQPPTVPAAPSNVGITAGNGTITLTWDAVADATSYRVKDTAGNLKATITAPTATWTATGLANGATYSYKVYAVNAQGESPRSSTVMAIPGTSSDWPHPVYAVPGDTRIDISWGARANTASYKLKRSTTSGGPYTVVATINSPAVTYVDTNVVNGTTYFYVMSSISSTATESNNSQQVSATPGASFAAPTNLSATIDGSARIPPAPTNLTATAALSWTGSTRRAYSGA